MAAILGGDCDEGSDIDLLVIFKDKSALDKGYKVGRGVMMIPMENLKAATEHLEKKGIDYVIRYVWV